MARARSLSTHARTVLSALLEARDAWCHGYDLAQSAGVKSGTLYPLLIRLEGHGYLEAEWQAPAEPGRPPRHAYRLTASGIRLAHDNPPDAKPAGQRRAATI
jgi:DNA-binding PadR family transcriptional regulator